MKETKYVVGEITDNSKSRIDKYLSIEENRYTRSYIQKLIDNKNILVNGINEIKPSYKVKKHDEIIVKEPENEICEARAEYIPIDIVYEDNDILIINKPKGMVVHPANGNYTGTLVNGLMYSHKDSLSGINGVIRPGIVHRIDKDTTGLLVIAKNDIAHKTLSEKFKSHDIIRSYVALVRGIIIKDRIDINVPIGRNEKDRKKMSATKKNSKNAITHISVKERFEKSGYTLIEATLETGRTHQIRVHMSYIGYPIVGDNVYSNGKNEFGVTGQMLHAKKLGFEHPITKKHMCWDAEPPQEFNNILVELRNRE